MNAWRWIGSTAFGIVWDLLSAPLYLPVAIAAAFSPKLRAFLRDKSSPAQLWRGLRDIQGPQVWFFCASMGEVDRAIPLADALASRGLSPVLFCHAIAGKRYAEAQCLYPSFLFPFDFHVTWRLLAFRFRPVLALWEKHEVWPGCLSALRAVGMPLVLFNAAPCATLPPAKRMLYQSVYRCFDHCFLSTGPSLPSQVVAGDTRLDRMKQRAQGIIRPTKIRASRRLLVLGNAYAEDAIFLSQALKAHPAILQHWRFLVLPNRPSQTAAIAAALPQALSCDWDSTPDTADISIANTLGQLFACYARADAAWVGGGFRAGIHNTLEPAFWGLTLASGPHLNGQHDALAFAQAGELRILQQPGDLADWLQHPSAAPTLPDHSPCSIILQHLPIP